MLLMIFSPWKSARRMAVKNHVNRKSTAVQNMKRQCRKAERMWRKTELEVHYSIHKDSLHAFNVELATARQTFFSNLINSNLKLNNTHTLSLLLLRDWQTPQIRFPVKCFSTANATSLLPLWNCFLRRSVISGRRLAHFLVMQRSHRFDRNFKKKWLSVFEEIDSKILEEIVLHLKSSICSLDTLPTSFFKSVLNCLEAALLEVVNTSLLSGTFPNSLKTAVVKPLLKKRDLDNTMLSNYRTISNLPFICKIIEKVVFNQLNKYLNSNDTWTIFNLVLERITELIKIINYIRLNSDSGKISVQVLLDLSAAFDTVDHNFWSYF